MPPVCRLCAVQVYVNGPENAGGVISEPEISSHRLSKRDQAQRGSPQTRPQTQPDPNPNPTPTLTLPNPNPNPPQP